ncbi:unnamed protein product (mitochondrion) [Parajaminaea phylloscopi]
MLGIKFPTFYRENIKCPTNINAILIGSILGNGSLDLQIKSKYPFFVITRPIRKDEDFYYIWFYYKQFRILCQSFPRISITKRYNKVHYYTKIWTRSYSFIIEFYNNFYSYHTKTINTETPIINKYTKKKTININYLLQNINDISLSIWAIEDGRKTGSGFRLATQKFTELEVYQLCGILHYKFNIVCSVNKAYSPANKFIIYISSRSITKFKSIVEPHFIPQIKYKLHGLETCT